jgi:hypothetical protein
MTTQVTPTIEITLDTSCTEVLMQPHFLGFEPGSLFFEKHIFVPAQYIEQANALLRFVLEN